MAIDLYDCQIEAFKQMKNGCILCGDVGSGKSRTSLAYYYISVCDGSMKVNGEGTFANMKKPRDLYIITTAKKRDSQEWEDEISWFCLDEQVRVTVDSWNNIKKYRKITGAFFIFDEQRVVGWGAWTKAFLDIARKNQWVLLSATPGDTWNDYIPVFVANGFYRNKTDFNAKHCVFSRFSKYPKIERYVDEGILLRHRRDILVPIEFFKKTRRIKVNISVDYDKELYKKVWRDRWDPYDDEPIAETGKLLYLLRKVVNSDESRIRAVKEIAGSHRKLIVFYNYTYELHCLRECFRELEFDIGEWNGEIHSQVPDGDRWAYLVQYTAGCEGWNCVATNTMIFYSQTYSYRQMTQAEGRIDRLNTAYDELYYYRLKSSAPIDIAIARALSMKRNFNEREFVGK